MILKRILLIFLCLILLASCTLQAPVSNAAPTVAQSILTAIPPSAVPPTAVPPTAVPPTAVPPTAVPPTKVPPTDVPTQKPTLASTATPSGMPQVPEAILILSPGTNSNILSPIQISGQADPTFEQNLIAKVTGDNGLSVGMKSTTIQAELGKRGAFSANVTFNVTRDQPGRVAVWSSSPKDGGLVHFSSIGVNLLASGSLKLLPGQTQSEPLVITSPAAAGAVFSAGKLHLEGWSGPVFENTISVVLCGEGGNGKSEPFCGTVDNVLARLSTTTNAPDIGQPGRFSLDITYKVTKPINGRVAVYFTSPRDGGLLHLTSMPVTLNP